MREKYELAVGGRVGPGLADAKEVSVLNRIIRWTLRGIKYEADPRQVEKLLHGIELEGASGAVTPGQKILAHRAEAEVELPPRLHSIPSPGGLRELPRRRPHRRGLCGEGGLSLHVQAD